MLTAKKTKLHGMKDARWLTKDKISQYKGLINLFRREKQIVSVDENLNARKQKFMLARLKKQLVASRQSLDNATIGDRQRIRNALAEHKNLQLAYSHLEVEKIIAHIHQQNFQLRKQIDLLGYKMRKKTDCLVNLKLTVAELQDRLEYSDQGKLPIEIYSKMATAQVQDAMLKKEGAVVVNESYKRILTVMKKDQIYFDAILSTLHVDILKQNRCMLDTIILGQMANEYLDDRKVEFQALEKAVKRDMAKRKENIVNMHERAQNMVTNVKYLIRRDSDMLIQTTTTKHVEEEDLTDLLRILDTLKDIIYVTNYDHLFPCIKEQRMQKERLDSLHEKCLNGRNDLLYKIGQADAIYSSFYNTMNETTFEYKQSKQTLNKQIKQQIHELKTIEAKHNVVSILLTRIKPALQHLEQICKVINVSKSVGAKAAFHFDEYHREKDSKLAMESIDIKNDGQKIIEVLIPKLENLVSKPIIPLTLYQSDKAQFYMQKLISNRTPSLEVEAPVLDVSLLEGLEMDDATIFSRKDIKKLSKEFVLKSTVDEDLVPLFAAPSKRRKKFK